MRVMGRDTCGNQRLETGREAIVANHFAYFLILPEWSSIFYIS